MKKELELGNLLRSTYLTTIMQSFALLLGPEVCLGVSDGNGHLLQSSSSLPSDVIAALLETAEEACPDDLDGAVITPQGAVAPICVTGQRLGFILATGPLPALAQQVLTVLRCTLESQAEVVFERRAIAQETLDRYREINLLYKLGDTLATCLDVDELPLLTLSEANRIIQARWGAVLLYDEAEELVLTANIGPAEDLERVIRGAWALLEETACTAKSRMLNDFVDGERRISLLAVPLHISERRLGVILLVDKIQRQGFTAGDEKLLAALSWQAAISLENARLFDNVRRQRDEIATMKRYMDNIFASIASGVITTDIQDTITTFNPAAEEILHISAQEAVGFSYQQVLGFLCETPLPALVKEVRQRGSAGITREISPYLPGGEQIHLNLNLSTLRGGGGENLGVAIVLDDVTEKRRYERERALVRRYLPPELVDRLPDDLAELGLHGERRMITAFFADLRSFTKFSEVNPSEQVFEVLNGYLTLAAEAVRDHGGIVDKYMGDAVMALFNTPLLEEPDHAWCAVQTAWELKKASEVHYRALTPEKRLFVGIGICTGEAVVGNVGAKGRMEYTAIGNPVNLGFHLQGCARPGQILLCPKTWELVRERIRANPLIVEGVKGHQTSTLAYELLGLVDESE